MASLPMVSIVSSPIKWSTRSPKTNFTPSSRTKGINVLKEINSACLHQRGTSHFNRSHRWRCQAEKNDSGLPEDSPDGESDKKKEDPKAEEPPVSGETPNLGFKVVPIWTKPEEPSFPSGIQKSDIDILRNQIFGFDTFFVTGQEPYEGGVMFKGNMRGESGTTFNKLSARIKEKFGEEFQLFFLSDPADDRTVAVILPSRNLLPVPSAVPSWLAAGAFGLTTVLSLLLHASGFADINLDFLPSLADIATGVPGFLVIASVLIGHEIGHLAAAKKIGLELGPPFFIPSLQLGTFGAITPIRGLVQNRQQLAEVATAGPIAGAIVALTILFAGLLLPPGDTGVVVQASAFHDSILIGGIAKLLLGSDLTENSAIILNPLVINAWTALLINSINCIPAGELDGGRIATAVWGRQVASRFSLLSIGLLALSGLFNDVALYFVVLLVFLQRGPVLPQADEITPIDKRQLYISLGTVVFSFLVYAPLLVPFS